jgi:ABC-2 type transport system ATP-binding protein
MDTQDVKIEVQNLSKDYGNVKAVSNVSFSVGTRQILGFLGPNGAGKTTVMKILTGFHFPTNGKAYVNGIAIDEEPLEVKKNIGYLPENVPLYGDMTVDEYLNFASDARFISKNERKAKISESLEACNLTQYRGRKIETLSKGYKQRAGLAQAILHDPPILILDEPTTGLDPNQIIEIRSLIKELGKSKTVILSTHILQEVEAVCSHVLIINEGKIAAQGKPDEIANSMKGGDTWELLLLGADRVSVMSKLEMLSGISNIQAEYADDEAVKVNFYDPALNLGRPYPGAKIFDWAVGQGLKILSMNRRKLSIEDIFVKLTGDESKQGGAE